MRKIRLLGGPNHGNIQTHTNEGYFRFCVPVFSSRTNWGSNLAYAEAGYPELSSPIHRVDYETRVICLGKNCRVEVAVPVDMTENEMYRRLADVIEGVGERTRP